MATPKRFILQGAFDDIWFKDLSTGKILAHLYDLKTNGLEDTIEMVYATGSRDRPYGADRLLCPCKLCKARRC